MQPDYYCPQCGECEHCRRLEFETDLQRVSVDGGASYDVLCVTCAAKVRDKRFPRVAMKSDAFAWPEGGLND